MVPFFENLNKLGGIDLKLARIQPAQVALNPRRPHILAQLDIGRIENTAVFLEQLLGDGTVDRLGNGLAVSVRDHLTLIAAQIRDRLAGLTRSVVATHAVLVEDRLHLALEAESSR